MNSTTAAERADITYRQLDHWITKGYIRPAVASPGSGAPREINAHEVTVLNLMAGLVREGFRPERAAEIARTMADGNPAVIVGEFCIVRTEGAA